MFPCEGAFLYHLFLFFVFFWHIPQEDTAGWNLINFRNVLSFWHIFSWKMAVMRSRKFSIRLQFQFWFRPKFLIRAQLAAPVPHNKSYRKLVCIYFGLFISYLIYSSSLSYLHNINRYYRILRAFISSLSPVMIV